MLGFCFERDDCYVLKREKISLIYKYVTPFTTVDNINRDEMIAPYPAVDYKIHGDIQGHTQYVLINIKLLVLGFKPFHSRYILLQLLTMAAVKYILMNTIKKRLNRVITTVIKKDVVIW